MNRNNQSFSERMEAARALKPATGGKNYPRAKQARDHYGDGESWESLCSITRAIWRKDKAAIANDFAVACLNPIDDQPENWEILL